MDMILQYASLNANDREALDEAIMDKGITTLPRLLEALNDAQRFINEQPGAKLTFQAFQATREAHSKTPEWCENNGWDPSHTEVFQYADECYIIVIAPGEFFLQIGNDIWHSNNLESLEWILYDQWYS
jgi:hypothetical protein